MFDTLCTYPLESDLFALDIHPSEPLIALGCASGHVQVNRLPASEASTSSEVASNTIVTEWRTRRHKGSCRSLRFSIDGNSILSAGTDGIVKIADASTGRVSSKIGVPSQNGSSIDSPTLVRPLSEQTLLLATDSSVLYLYDTRILSETSISASTRPVQTHHPHEDYITSLSVLPSPSADRLSSQWLSTGGTTVAIGDVRRGIIVQSEDQGEELLSSTLFTDDKVLVGGEKGILRVWQIGIWDDNEITINVGGKEKASAESLSAVPDSEIVAVGMDDGTVRYIDMSGKRGKVIERATVTHDDIEGVGCLAFSNENRMVSGGGTMVKIWEERTNAAGAESGGLDAEPDGSDSPAVEEDFAGENSEEHGSSRRRKRRKRNKPKSDSSGSTGQSGFTFRGLD